MKHTSTENVFGELADLNRHLFREFNARFVLIDCAISTTPYSLLARELFGTE